MKDVVPGDSEVNEPTAHDGRARGFDTPKLVSGLLLVTMGTIFLLDRLYWFDASEAFRLWPLWLMAFGVLRVAFPGRSRTRLAGFWPILIGSIFLLDTFDVMSIRESWPLFIVGGGLLMVLRALGFGVCDRHPKRMA